MKIEDQVCSLELAKKLKELGIRQESLWYWSYQSFITGYEWRITMSKPDFGEDQIIEQTTDAFSAFGVAELGEMLPNPLHYKGKRIFFGSEKVGGYWECGSEGMLEHTFEAKVEADARAKMLIYLLENKLLNLIP